MSQLYSFATDDTERPIIDHEISKQVEFLLTFNWYHSELERKDAEDRIISNGEFLVRLSSYDTKKFVVTTKWNGEFLHVIIKTDVNVETNQLVYYIDFNYKFETVSELIKFHKEQQQPLSIGSGATLYTPVDKNRVLVNGTIGRESKFRKGSNIMKKIKSVYKPFMARSGSETELNVQRYSTPISNINKSLNDLTAADTESPKKPIKPHTKALITRRLLSKCRPSHIKIRNKQLYNESGDYTDYYQLKDNNAALKREQERRGFSAFENESPSLIGFSSLPKDMVLDNDSTYVLPNTTKSVLESDKCDLYLDNINNTTSDTFDIYGLPIINNEDVNDFNKGTLKRTRVVSSIGLNKFINTKLSTHYLSCCGPVSRIEFDKDAINKAASFLLSKQDHYLTFCKHLVDELKRIFRTSCYEMDFLCLGYRSIFIPNSIDFVEDLKTRQTVLSQFITATIMCTNSLENRVQMILFWIRCAEHLQHSVHDVYHFRSIINVILSEQVTKLTVVWKTVYKQQSGVRRQMESFRAALSDGTHCSTDINCCIPDLVELHEIFIGDQHSHDKFWTVAEAIRGWGDWGGSSAINRQSNGSASTSISTNSSAVPFSTAAFDSPNTWLVKISTKMECFVQIPFLRELVQTETLLSMMFGARDYTQDDLSHLTDEVETKLYLLFNKPKYSDV